MSVHPDKTAYRAVDACGGTYTPEQYANGYAEGHAAALDEAMEAVKKPDELTAELLEALWEAEKALVVIRQNVMVEVIGGNARFEGVPEILAKDIAGIRAVRAKASAQ